MKLVLLAFCVMFFLLSCQKDKTPRDIFYSYAKAELGSGYSDLWYPFNKAFIGNEQDYNKCLNVRSIYLEDNTIYMAAAISYNQPNIGGIKENFQELWMTPTPILSISRFTLQKNGHSYACTNSYNFFDRDCGRIDSVYYKNDTIRMFYTVYVPDREYNLYSSFIKR